MTMCYGSFLLHFIPTDALQTEAQCLDVLEQFANYGFCPMFREIVQERVVEFQYDAQTKTTSHRWLEGAEAEPVLNCKNLGNCVPASWLENVALLGPVLIPQVLKRGSASLGLETGLVDRIAVSDADGALAEIYEMREQLLQMSEEELGTYLDPRDTRELLVEFYDELLHCIEECKKAGVIYILCELVL